MNTYVMIILMQILTNVSREHLIVSNCVPTLMDHTFAPVMMTSVLDWIHIAVSVIIIFISQ